MINNYSPNMLKTYQSCKKKFYYQYVEKINIPQSSLPFLKGKKIHALANYYLKGLKIDKLEQNLEPNERKIWEKLKSNQYFNKDFFESEFCLYARVGNFYIGGRIDAIVKDGDVYYILDYKTGQVPENPEYDYQTMIYLLCLDKYIKNFEKLFFIYIDLKNDKNHLIEFDNFKKQKYESQIIEICNSIEADNFYNVNKVNCRYCEYSKICNYYNA